MKSIQSLFIIGIVFSMILNSCSIEKRVYRPGYHIEWNKSGNDHKTQDVSSVDEMKSSDEKVILSEVKTREENNSVGKGEMAPSNNDNKSEEKSEKSISIGGSEKISEAETKPIFEIASELKTEKKVFSTKSENNHLQGFGEGKSGVFMLVIGLLLLGLAWVFYTYFGVFGIIFGLIFLIGGGIYFIAGIIVLIANA